MDLIADENGILFQQQYIKDIENELTPNFPMVKELGNPPIKLPDSQKPYSKLLTNVFKTNVIENSKPSFSVFPETVQFFDFDPGQTYTSKVSVTNCTSRLRRIRVLPISPQHRIYFALDSNVSPPISPGLQWTIIISFSSNTSEFVSGELDLKVDDGSLIKILLKARPKQPELSTNINEIDFGTVTIGDYKKKILSIRNQGSLSGKVKISGTFENVIRETHTDPLTKEEKRFLSILPNVYKFDVLPQSERKIELEFAPLEKCQMLCNIFLEGNFLNKMITLKAKSTNLPVFVSSGDIDFHCCFYGSVYSTKVEVQNTLLLPTIVIAKVPTHFKDVIRFEPASIIIQPNTSLSFDVLFTPSVDLGSDINILVELHAKEQSIPASVRILASLTHRGFSIDERNINIGMMFINEEKCHNFSAQNLSDLPQEIECTNLPKSITVIPRKVTLLPKESFQFQLFFKPLNAEKINSPFKLRNKYGDSVTLRLFGSAIEPVLFFSESTIFLPACPFGGCISASTVLTNNSDECQDFNFSTPCEFLFVSPSTGVLRPRESVPILVFFEPRKADSKKEELEKILPLNLHKQKLNTLKNSTNIVSTPLLSDDFLSLFGNWDKSTSSRLARHRIIKIQCTSNEGHVESVFIVIHCTVIFPEITVAETTNVENVLPKPVYQQPPTKQVHATGLNSSGIAHKLTTLSKPMGCSVKLNFSEVPMGQAVTKSCLIKNNSDIPVNFQIQPFSPMSNFSIVRPPSETLEPNQVDYIFFQFKPREYGIFYDDVTLFCELNNLTIQLKGLCTAIDLFVTTDSNLTESNNREAPVINEIVFPPTLVGDTSQRLLYFHNLGNSVVDVLLEFANECNDNKDSSMCNEPFVFQLTAFTAPPGSKTVVAALFYPQNVGRYSTTVCVIAGKFKKTIVLNGWSTTRKIYTRSTFSDHFDYVNGRRVSPLNLTFEGSSEDFPFVLNFTAGETKNLIFGSVKGGPSAECVVNALESFTTDGWVVSDQKMTVASGSESIISFTLGYRKPSDNVKMCFGKYAINIKCPADPSNDCTFFYHLAARE
ncbi:unnamed protein product [Phytomonas sp. Hart1]|nr:unnamed protein product [Phytomonas sp. Hart1]|eukprot:CCW69179.1 unnamed protein product [Phytomonas sp. isolate Hart1]